MTTALASFPSRTEIASFNQIPPKPRKKPHPTQCPRHTPHPTTPGHGAAAGGTRPRRSCRVNPSTWLGQVAAWSSYQLAPYYYREGACTHAGCPTPPVRVCPTRLKHQQLVNLPRQISKSATVDTVAYCKFAIQKERAEDYLLPSNLLRMT